MPHRRAIEAAVFRARQSNAIGHHRRAVELAREGLQLAPYHWELMGELCRGLYMSGHDRDAEYVARDMLGIAPGDVWAMRALALALKTQDRLDEAYDVVRTARSHAPQDPGVLDTFSRVCIAAWRFAEAEDAALTLQQIAPDDEHTSELFAELRRVQERREEALAHAEQAIERNPEASSAHMIRATVLFELERYDDAFASFRDALALAPDDAWLHARIEDLTDNYLRARSPQTLVGLGALVGAAITAGHGSTQGAYASLVFLAVAIVAGVSRGMGAAAAIHRGRFARLPRELQVLWASRGNPCPWPVDEADL